MIVGTCTHLRESLSFLPVFLTGNPILIADVGGGISWDCTMENARVVDEMS